ncbi:hypothetical protein AJ80_04827 [Polytolypa hystricis UAMH7299]|uniref:Chromo domain-containing protein n=1 Tax=Polytolypa hystricis (strain UAMH7299) TaxID=1447883 RepID=A0A2B7Y932_POLH7|nr:hypothetical protein AJ80_04827 [Polytolypa hystricis UAMH7299]
MPRRFAPARALEHFAETPVELSDEESAGEEIPFQEAANNAAEEPEPEAEEGDESGDDEEDVYVVEKILGHGYAKDGTVLYTVKWKGYEGEEDQTEEPEDNLEGAPEALAEYFEIIGGRPEKQEKPARKRKSVGASTATSDRTSKKARRSRGAGNGTPTTDTTIPNWVPKSGNWDKDIESVDTIMREPGTGDLHAYLNWKNGKKSKVPMPQCYEKCPMKMLQFYEKHLVFKEG